MQVRAVRVAVGVVGCGVGCRWGWQWVHDAYQQAITAQKGEGCRMWGRMQVRVVRVVVGCGDGCS